MGVFDLFWIFWDLACFIVTWIIFIGVNLGTHLLFNWI